MSDAGALSDSSDRLFTCSNDPIPGLPNSLVNDTRNQSGGMHSSMTMDFSGSELDLPVSRKIFHYILRAVVHVCMQGSSSPVVSLTCWPGHSPYR